MAEQRKDGNKMTIYLIIGANGEMLYAATQAGVVKDHRKGEYQSIRAMVVPDGTTKLYQLKQYSEKYDNPFEFSAIYSSEEDFRDSSECAEFMGGLEAAEVQPVPFSSSYINEKTGVRYVVKEVDIDTNGYEFCPEELKVLIFEGPKGLYARINNHPEVDGEWALGKVFFPVRNSKLTAGWAKVTITKECDTYGFIDGDNIRYPAFDRCAFAEEVYNLLCATMENNGSLYDLGRVCHYATTLGDAYIYRCGNKSVALGGADAHNLFAFNGTQNGHLVSSEDALDFVFSGSICKTKADIISSVVSPSYQEVLRRMPSGLLKHEVCELEGDSVFQSALDDGLIETNWYSACPDIYWTTFDERRLFLLATYTAEEVDSIIRQMNAINENNKIAMQRFLKKNPLRV